MFSSARALSRVRRKDDFVRIHCILREKDLAEPAATLTSFPPVQHFPRVPPVAVRTVVSSTPRRRKCSITSGTPPARKTRTVG